MMAKRDPSLTKIKDHSYKFPLAGVASRNAKAQVLLNPETGIFSMKYPPEVIALTKCGEVASSRQLNEVIGQFERTIGKYGSIVRSQNRERVIVVNYKRNWTGRAANGEIHTYSVGSVQELGGAFARDIPMLGMGLDYEILWKIEGRGIFEIGFNDDGTPAGDPEHRYSADPQGFKIIPWTEEREAFFKAMRDGLGNMIDRMNNFFSADYLANIDRAIANGGSGLALGGPQAALPAPEGD